MAFDPDAYLASTAPAETGGGFDPDAYLAQSAPQVTDAPATPAPVAAPEKKPKLALPPKQVSPARSMARGILAAANQGTTLGFGDELAAGILTPIAQLSGAAPEGQTWAETYKDIRDAEQTGQAEWAKENPKTAFAAELGGGLVTAGLTGGSSMLGKQGIGAVAKEGAKQGAKLGAVYGAGASEGGDTLVESAINTAKGAAQGGVLGAVTGGTVTPALVAGGKAVNNVVSNIASRFFKDNTQKATEYVRQLAKRSGYTPDELAQRLDDLGPQATLADVSENLLAGAKASVDQLGRTKEAARNLVTQRQLAQQKETLGILSKQLGDIGPDDLSVALKKAAEERAQKAGPLYQKALSQDVPETELLQKLRATPTFEQAYNQAGTYAKNDLSRVTGSSTSVDDYLLTGNKTYDPGKLTEGEKLHYAKMALHDMESAQARAGNTNAARQIADLRKNLTNELDQLPGYKEARQIWSGSKSADDAAEMGRNILKASTSEFTDAVSGMNSHELDMARKGVMEAIAEKVGDKADNQTVADILTKNPNMRQKVLALMGGDEEAMKALEKNAAKWAQFTKTKNKITGGSPTSENMMASQESAKLVQAISDPISFAKNALLDSVMNPYRMTPETADKVGEILLKQGMGRDEVINLLTPKAPGRNVLTKAVGGSFVPAEGATTNALMRDR